MRGNPVALGGIDEAEQDQMGEQQMPMRAEAAQQVFPIEYGSASAEQVNDVRSIETLAFHDVGLLPNQLFGGTEQGADRFQANRVREPVVVHRAKTIPGGEDHVDEIISTEGFTQPMREGHFRTIAGLLQRLQGARRIRDRKSTRLNS